MLIKTIAGIALFALVGAAVGYSKILCPDGGCAITGTSYGGALFGGVLGMAVMSGLNNRATPTDQPPEEDND
jgi:hypothetical protein